ncbi:MAG: YdeI/OmpD-associated family protein [Planctomycetaceae bacterium]
MTGKNQQVQTYIDSSSTWKKELTLLRQILLTTELKEEFKWHSCYTFENNNVLILSSLKRVALSAFSRVLLKDKHQVLSKPGENSQSARVIRFRSVDKIVELEPILKKYISEAIQIQQKGLKVDFDQKGDLDFPPELQDEFKRQPKLKKAFEALTPGRQRGYILFFNGAKQSKSRIARINKETDRILAGKGIHDCICGLSNKLPSCDGSHKALKK